MRLPFGALKSRKSDVGTTFDKALGPSWKGLEGLAER